MQKTDDSFLEHVKWSIVSLFTEDIFAVKQWLNQKDFRNEIKNEVFEPLNLSAFQCIGKLPEIAVSKKWFRLNSTYIPKNMIFDFVVVNGPTMQQYDTIRLFALNGLEWEVIKVKEHQVKSFLRRMSSALGRKTAGTYNGCVVRNMYFTKAFRNLSRICLEDKNAFLQFISIPIHAPEYNSHPFIKECVRFVSACFIETYLQNWSRNVWWMSSDGRVFSKDAGCLVILTPMSEREHCLEALVKNGTEDGQKFCILQEQQYDFPYNENVRRSCIEFSRQFW